MPLRIGLFGGTFDPPHLGHLVTAVNVRHALQLDLVILMVANDPWQKQGARDVSRAADRLALVKVAVDGIQGLTFGDEEIRRGGPSYTADTVAELAIKYPQADLFTIVGDDAAANFGTWNRAAEIASRSTLVVVDRPGSPLLPPCEFLWNRVEVPRLEISSTDLRMRFVDGRPLDYLVQPRVLVTIQELGLYRGASK